METIMKVHDIYIAALKTANEELKAYTTRVIEEACEIYPSISPLVRQLRESEDDLNDYEIMKSIMDSHLTYPKFAIVDSCLIGWEIQFNKKREKPYSLTKNFGNFTAHIVDDIISMTWVDSIEVKDMLSSYQDFSKEITRTCEIVKHNNQMYSQDVAQVRAYQAKFQEAFPRNEKYVCAMKSIAQKVQDQLHELTKDFTHIQTGNLIQRIEAFIYENHDINKVLKVKFYEQDVALNLSTFTESHLIKHDQ